MGCFDILVVELADHSIMISAIYTYDLNNSRRQTRLGTRDFLRTYPQIFCDQDLEKAWITKYHELTIQLAT